MVGLMTILIFALGAYAFTKLDQELFPSVSFDQTFIMIETEEMPAEDVEQFITVPVEQTIENIKHVNEYGSTSTNGAVTFYVDIENGKGKEVTKELESKVNQLTSDLYGIKDVHVEQISTSQQYEFFLDISGGSLTEMSKFAKDVIEPRLESLPEVNDVRLSGLEEKEVKITLLTDKLMEYELTPDFILQNLEQLNTSRAIGTLAKEEGEPAIRWNTSLTNISDVKNLSLQTNQGIIKLKEVAKIEEKTSDNLSGAWKNGDPNFIIVEVGRANGYTQIEMAEAVRAELKEIEKENTSSIKVNEVVAQADYVSNAIDGVTSNIIIGGMIAMVVLMLFLRNVRATFIVGLSIPASILLTILTMVLLDYSFNLISLIGLGLGIGMMVDASVVVLESIFKKKELGYSNFDAVITGTKEVVSPVIASMLTTIVVFVPISIMEDDIGVMMVILTIVVAITLISSVIVAFTLIPTLAENFLTLKRKSKQKNSRIIDRYGKMIEWITKKKRRRLSVISIFIIILISSFFLLPNIPMKVMPDILNRYSEILVELEPGVNSDVRAEIAAKINDELQKVQDVESNIILDFHDLLVANINMTTEEQKTREQSDVNEEILERIRALEDDFPIASVTTSIDGMSGLPIGLQVSGKDLKELERIADETVEKLNSIEHLVSIKTEIGESANEFTLKLHDKKMEEDGVTPEYLYSAISQKFFDIPAGELIIDGETIPLKISNDLTIENRDQLLKEKIPTMYGENELAKYVSFDKSSSLGEINRHNGERYINIVADYEGEDLGSIHTEIQKIIKDMQLEEGYTVSLIGELEKQQQTMEDILMILAISILLVFMVMAIQFNSLAHPFIIILIIPFTLTGVLLGLFLSQSELNIMSGIGIIMLVGIVLNNGILLIDRIKQLRLKGDSVFDAVVAAGKDRIRPIFITTLMTVGGMIPLALATGSSSGYQAPLAIVIISGLLYSTLISLVLIPSIYLVFEDIKILLTKLFRKKKVNVRSIEAKAHVQ